MADPTTHRRSWPFTLAIGAVAAIVLAGVGAPRHAPAGSTPPVRVSRYVERPGALQPRVRQARRPVRADLEPYYVHPSLLETPLHDDDARHAE